MGPNPILEKEFIADGTIASDFLLVKKGTNENDVSAASAATDAIMGVAQHDVLDNQRVRVMLSGISKVIYGGTVAQGDLLTSDANGRAVAASPAAGVNNRVAGVAMAGGVLNDVGRVLLVQGRIQG